MEISAEDMLISEDSSEVVVHPLVILSMSDHYTRARLGQGRGTSGILLGQLNTVRVEVFTSFPAVLTDGDLMDVAEVKRKREQMLSVFPTYEVVGWYAVGSRLSTIDFANAQAVMEAFELGLPPLTLLLDPNPSPSRTALPLYALDWCKSTVRRVPLSIKSEETERIGAELASNLEHQNVPVNTLVPTSRRLALAVSLLRDRLSVILAYLRGVREGSLQPDATLLRHIASLCAVKNMGSQQDVRQWQASEYVNALLVTSLSALTKCSEALESVVSRTSRGNEPLGPPR